MVRFVGGEEVHGEDSHVKGSGAFGQGAAKGPKADNTHRATIQLHQVGPNSPHGPLPPLLVKDTLTDTPGKSEDHPKGTLGQAGAVGTTGAGQQYVALDQLLNHQVIVYAGTGSLDPL